MFIMSLYYITFYLILIVAQQEINIASYSYCVHSRINTVFFLSSFFKMYFLPSLDSFVVKHATKVSGWNQICEIVVI